MGYFLLASFFLYPCTKTSLRSHSYLMMVSYVFLKAVFVKRDTTTFVENLSTLNSIISNLSK